MSVEPRPDVRAGRFNGVRGDRPASGCKSCSRRSLSNALHQRTSSDVQTTRTSKTHTLDRAAVTERASMKRREASALRRSDTTPTSAAKRCTASVTGRRTCITQSFAQRRSMARRAERRRAPVSCALDLRVAPPPQAIAGLRQSTPVSPRRLRSHFPSCQAGSY